MTSPGKTIHGYSSSKRANPMAEPLLGEEVSLLSYEGFKHQYTSTTVLHAPFAEREPHATDHND